jgi:hypothetical protein
MRQLGAARIVLRRVSKSNNSQRLFVSVQLTAARQAWLWKREGRPHSKMVALRVMRDAR